MTAPNKLDREGTLQSRPISRLLLRYLEAGVTGTLRIQRGEVHTDIFIHDGRPIGAASNLRHQALGSLLKARGILDDQQLSYLLEEMRKRNARMGEVLVALGWMTPEDVLQFMAAQVRMRIVDVLRWNEGRYQFSDDRSFLNWVIEHDFDVSELVFWGLRRSAIPGVIAQSLSDAYGSYGCIRTGPRFARYQAAFHTVFGADCTDILATTPVAALAGQEDAGRLLGGAEAIWLCDLADTKSGDQPHQTPAMTRVASNVPSTPAPEIALAGAIPTVTLTTSAEGHQAGTEDEWQPPSGIIVFSAMAALSLQETYDRTNDVQMDDPRQMVLREYLRSIGGRPHEILQVPSDASWEQVEIAYENKKHQFSNTSLPESQLADILPRLRGVQTAIERAYRNFRQPIKTPSLGGPSKTPVGDTVKAELHFQKARSLLAENQQADAVLQLQEAIACAPEVAEYHTVLGWTLFHLPDADQDAIRHHADSAIALDPGYADARVLSGMLWHRRGRDDEARQSLEHALALDPTRLDAVEALRAIHDQCGEHHSTEALYRGVIRSLGETALPLRQILWKSLAELYEAEFDDVASARVAYEMAARLTPDDRTLQKKVLDLNAGDTTHWPAIARALVAEWRANPDDTSALGALHDLYRRVERQDGAIFVACTLVTMDAASAEQAAIARALPPAQAMVPVPIADMIGVVNENADMTALFDLLVEHGVIPIPEPKVPTDPFRLAYASAMSSPGRQLARSMSGRHLKPYLLACISFAVKTLATEDVDVAAIRDHLTLLPPEAQQHIRSLATNLTQQAPGLNVSLWAAAVRQSAARVGLLATGDLVSACKAVAEDEDEDAVRALLEFAISPEHLYARDRLATPVR